jgi:hypothetical protein
MAIFVLIPKNSSVQIDLQVESAFPGNSLKLDSGSWLVAATGTPREIAAKIGVTEKGGPAVFIASMNEYWGLHPAPVWDWLASKRAVK